MGWGVMEANPGVPLQPSLCGCVFVDIEVVENHVQLLLGKSFDYFVQKAQKVDRGAALLDLGYDLSAGDFQGRQQGLCAVTDIFVGPTAGFLCAQGQQGLGAIQRLNAGLFVDTQHQRIFRRIQIQADNVQQFGFEIGIRAEGKGANPMGCRPESARIWCTVLRGNFKSLASVLTLQRL